MGERRSHTAAIEIADTPTLTTKEDDAPVESIAALRIEQAETPKQIERITLSREMPAQAPAGGIANLQFLDRGGIVQSALVQIVECHGIAIELVLIESGSLLQHSGRIGGRSTLLLEVSEALAKGQLARQLDKAQKIAALAATVTVEEIFVGIDIERGPGFLVQRTEADELGAVTGRPADPILLPHIVEQRKALFEFFEILAHGAVLPPHANVEEDRQYSQARMVDAVKFFSDAGAREFCRTSVTQDKCPAS
jgi:hypothetical protein